MIYHFKMNATGKQKVVFKQKEVTQLAASSLFRARGLQGEITYVHSPTVISVEAGSNIDAPRQRLQGIDLIDRCWRSEIFAIAEIFAPDRNMP